MFIENNNNDRTILNGDTCQYVMVESCWELKTIQGPHVVEASGKWSVWKKNKTGAHLDLNTPATSCSLIFWALPGMAVDTLPAWIRIHQRKRYVTEWIKVDEHTYCTFWYIISRSSWKWRNIPGWWFGFFICPSIGNYHPSWLTFFKAVETTNQIQLIFFSSWKTNDFPLSKVAFPMKTCDFPLENFWFYLEK